MNLGAEKNTKNPTLREAAFGCDFVYGITMVPCSFALQLAEKVLRTEGDQFIEYAPKDSP